jgi:AraC family transcriptional regulator, transcriptional activator of pobA
MYKFDLEKELPLSYEEAIRKGYYLNRHDIFSVHSLTEYIKSHYDKVLSGTNSDWVEHLIKKTDEYAEDSFIPSGFDVSVIKHGRYAPPELHCHTFFEIVCVMRGSCMNQVASYTLEMKAGDICIIAPKTKHAIHSFDDDCILLNLLVRVSTFDQAFFGTLVEKDFLASFFSKTLYGTIAPEAYIIFHAQGDEEIESYITQAYEEFKGKRIYKERMLNHIITMFFITLLRNHGKDAVNPNPEGKTSNDKITAILNYIQTNYKTVSIAELASAFNYSERHITRLLKEYTGESFLSILQKIKFNKAAELLSNPDLSIQEIAEITGYTDISHFYRMFRKHYNMTPIQYREMKL